MENKYPYRTIFFLCWMSGVLLAGFIISALRGVPEPMFSSFGWCVVGLGLGGAAKAVFQHASDGTGLKGAVATLLTNAKPGDPAPEAPRP